MHALRTLAVLLSLPLLAACDVNNIPVLDERVSATWAEVENQYQRRADLIPNLVAVVEQAQVYERETLEAVANARSKITGIKRDISPADAAAMQAYEDAQTDMSLALGNMLAYVERYPELQVNRDFLALMSQLEGTENRIALARREFVAAIAMYNTELRTFPGRLWRATLYRDMQLIEEYYSASAPDADQAPTVEF